VSGIQDLERILEMTRHFRLPTVVTVNKGDLHPRSRETIQDRCRALGVPVLPWIPFQESVTRALLEGRPITEHEPASAASQALAEIWASLKDILKHGVGRPLQLSGVPSLEGSEGRG
jgi:MinD superfamily P-loop ATPase